MLQARSETTASPEPPFSPFSSSLSTAGSDGITSDEPGDLGAFTSVWSAIRQFQAAQLYTTQTSASESEAGTLSTIWSNGRPTSSRVSSTSGHENEHDDDTRSPSMSESDTTTTTSTSTDDSESESVTEGEVAQAVEPTLGSLASALDFLAAEKARLAAQLDTRSGAPRAGSGSAPIPAPSVSDSKRRRRRKRKAKRPFGPDEDDEPTPTSSVEPSSSPEILSSSPPKPTVTVPITPKRKRRHRHFIESYAPTPRLASASLPLVSPSPRSPLMPPDPRLQRLRGLSRKLRTAYPDEAPLLSKLFVDEHVPGSFIDPRGLDPLPNGGQPLVHVFIDHSNILIGLLSWVKRQPPGSIPIPKREKPKLSHAALVLLLERGRAVTRRVLVASSPLHQSLESANDLGYEVSVLQRVAVMDESGEPASWKSRKTRGTTSTTGNGPQANKGSSTESDPGPSASTSAPTKAPPPRPTRRPGQHARSASSITGPVTAATTAVTTVPAPGPSSGIGVPGPSNGRVRLKYREQAVDELLQLKLLQALLDTPAPPPSGSTIVLATGDGASSQFNEDGFLGCVKRAVERGWRVELVGWESGLSRAWLSVGEFGRTVGGKEFTITGLDKYGADLLEI